VRPSALPAAHRRSIAARIETTSAPLPDAPVELVFDHPFVFALRDRISGAVLFIGRVADPRG